MKLLAIMHDPQRTLSVEIWGDLTGGEYGVIFKDEEAQEVLLSRRYRLKIAAMRDAMAFVSGDTMPLIIDQETAARHCA